MVSQRLASHFREQWRTQPQVPVSHQVPLWATPNLRYQTTVGPLDFDISEHLVPVTEKEVAVGQQFYGSKHRTFDVHFKELSLPVVTGLPLFQLKRRKATLPRNMTFSSLQSEGARHKEVYRHNQYGEVWRSFWCDSTPPTSGAILFHPHGDRLRLILDPTMFADALTRRRKASHYSMSGLGFHPLPSIVECTTVFDRACLQKWRVVKSKLGATSRTKTSCAHVEMSENPLCSETPPPRTATRSPSNFDVIYFLRQVSFFAPGGELETAAERHSYPVHQKQSRGRLRSEAAAIKSHEDETPSVGSFLP
ncbi:hypothetical protein MKZ38_000648 [Zalerion maritima]|uniref:Uncharacterized protein n=1 Tax=Zalerion maritima TaxID=339359 RepID=A0AAD5RSD5_9PEZI|nr:hypothetical protein MKZ38_000648 [Zalerion maritima]